MFPFDVVIMLPVQPQAIISTNDNISAITPQVKKKNIQKKILACNFATMLSVGR